MKKFLTALAAVCAEGDMTKEKIKSITCTRFPHKDGLLCWRVRIVFGDDDHPDMAAREANYSIRDFGSLTILLSYLQDKVLL